MFKSIFTIMRGQAAETEQNFNDANALPILRQQMRDAAVSVKRSRSAAGHAIAGHEQELARHKKLQDQIADLEARALEALEKNKDEMARDAADAIAALENECAASLKAQTRFETEITRLKSDIRAAQIRLRNLQSGERLATTTHHTQKLHCASPIATTASLSDAETTLERLELRQQNLDIARKAEADLEAETSPTNIAERMAAQGIGKPLRSTADEVLERLKAKKTSK